MFRHGNDTYSSRYVDWRGGISMRIARRGTIFMQNMTTVRLFSSSKCAKIGNGPSSKSYFAPDIHFATCLYPLQRGRWRPPRGVMVVRGASGMPEHPLVSPTTPQCIRIVYTHSRASGINPNPRNHGLPKKWTLRLS